MVLEFDDALLADLGRKARLGDVIEQRTHHQADGEEGNDGCGCTPLQDPPRHEPALQVRAPHPGKRLFPQHHQFGRGGMLPDCPPGAARAGKRLRNSGIRKSCVELPLIVCGPFARLPAQDRSGCPLVNGGQRLGRIAVADKRHR